MKSSFQRLAVGFQQAARGLWRERWNVVMGGGLFAVAVLVMRLIEK
jgi:hypothetical protein